MTKKEFMNFSLDYKLKFNSISKNFTQELNYENFKYLIKKDRKPILRTFSDLNKEIQVGTTYLDYLQCMFNLKSDEIYNIKGLIYSNLAPQINELQFAVVIKLIEWKFDVAGLIEKGDALDYSTIDGFFF